MLIQTYKCGLLLLLAFCFFDSISSSPQRKIKQIPAASNATTLHSATNQTTATKRMLTRLTDSYLPPTMQALAYYIELLQYEPVHMTTIEPPFTIASSTPTFPNLSPSTPKPPPFQQPVTWWSPPSTTTQKATTWWSPPSTTTQKPTTTSWWTNPSTTSSWWTTTTQRPWWNPPFVSSDSQSESSTTTSTTTTTKTTTKTPRPSTTTPSWWHQETTPFHKPGNVQPDSLLPRPASNSESMREPNKAPQMGDLSFLSISSFPHFEYFVKPNSKSFVKKPEYEYLHQFPAELLQDIESEEPHERKGSDLEIANDFRRIYDDFFARVRVFSPITGKKRVPPTRPYVLFLIFYDLCKREAKRLNLQEFTGYSPTMLEKLHEISKYSAERQMFTLLDELYQQKSIVSNDFTMRMMEIMTDLSNPNSVTAKALRILPPLKFEP
ncbi:uncharacterized protein LOC116342305 [Contarinia nasturtii]|uniref:uncharacterized protein LOC116342305 n=1 Tax=Contarinia nasturtii TaxID=265458 RepID=UPI0012D3DF7A|nr:uncharacterized protein LOC116342305 [Contarinia nasturtii]